MKNINYKGYLVTFERQPNGSILCYAWGDNDDSFKRVCYFYPYAQVVRMMKEDINHRLTQLQGATA
jgi:hypothetical protein